MGYCGAGEESAFLFCPVFGVNRIFQRVFTGLIKCGENNGLLLAFYCYSQSTWAEAGLLKSRYI